MFSMFNGSCKMSMIQEKRKQLAGKVTPNQRSVYSNIFKLVDLTDKLEVFLILRDENGAYISN
jgi:hypothetical protein